MSGQDYQKTIDGLPKKPEAPVFPGRPNRDKVINKSDIINLKIALNTAKSLEAFLGMV